MSSPGAPWVRLLPCLHGSADSRLILMHVELLCTCQRFEAEPDGAGETFPFFKPNFSRMESYRADIGADDVRVPLLHGSHF